MTPMRLAAALLALPCFAGIAHAGLAAPISIPEPSTMALLATGVAGIALARKLRKRK